MQLPVDKIRELCKKHGIMVFILFGSYAANRFDSESDVDVAILVKNPVSILKSRTRILKKLSDLFGYKDIDLVLLNHADPLLKFNIAREGKLIYEETKGLFNIFKVRAMSEHNDAKKFYQLEKEFVKQYIERGKLNGKPRVSPPQTK